MMKIKASPKVQPVGYRFVTDDYEMFQVICVLGGTVHMRVREEDIVLRAGAVAILRYGGKFELFCREEGYHGVAAITDEPVPGRSNGPPLALVAPPPMRSLASLIDEEMSNPQADSTRILEPLGVSLFNYALRLMHEHGLGDVRNASSEYWAELVRETIERNVYSGRRLEESFGKMDLGYRQLSRHFQREYGMSPKQYQLLCRLEEARRLLSGTRLSITSIAMELGFPTSQHFAAQFRTHAGMTPTEFRATKA